MSKRPRIATIISKYEVIISVGRNDGVSPGQEYSIYSEFHIPDPSTGEILETIKNSKAIVKVTKVFEKASIAKSSTERKVLTGLGSYSHIMRSLGSLSNLSGSEYRTEITPLDVDDKDITPIYSTKISVGDDVELISQKNQIVRNYDPKILEIRQDKGFDVDILEGEDSVEFLALQRASIVVTHDNIIISIFLNSNDDKSLTDFSIPFSHEEIDGLSKEIEEKSSADLVDFIFYAPNKLKWKNKSGELPNSETVEPVKHLLLLYKKYYFSEEE